MISTIALQERLSHSAAFLLHFAHFTTVRQARLPPSSFAKMGVCGLVASRHFCGLYHAEQKSTIGLAFLAFQLHSFGEVVR
jgi:hypothetical protein